MKDGDQSTESFSIWPKLTLNPIEPSRLEASDAEIIVKTMECSRSAINLAITCYYDIIGVGPSVVEGTYNYSH